MSLYVPGPQRAVLHCTHTRWGDAVIPGPSPSLPSQYKLCTWGLLTTVPTSQGCHSEAALRSWPKTTRSSHSCGSGGQESEVQAGLAPSGGPGGGPFHSCHPALVASVFLEAPLFVDTLLCSLSLHSHSHFPCFSLLLFPHSDTCHWT